LGTVTGIFTSAASAGRAVARVQELGIGPDHINILTPNSNAADLDAVPTSDTEQPGMGAALGGLVGGVSGLTLGTAAASLLIPGVGPITAIGIIAAALFGTGGVVAGAAAGEALEDSMSDGLPKDELFLYEDALRQGRTVLIVQVEDTSLIDAVRDKIHQEGAETIDAARERWWIGLRDVEQQHYDAASGAEGRDFTADESAYRRGFESALHPRLRGRVYDEAMEDLRRMHPDACESDPFRRGYERGREWRERGRTEGRG